MNNSLARLKFNDPAPDLEVTTSDGEVLKLSSLWQGRVLLLAFTRHFGCPQCKEMIDELLQFKPEFAARGLSLAVVTQGTPDAARAFCSERLPGVTCLADPERQAYHAFGLGRATLAQTFFSSKVMKSNSRLKKEKGWKTELPPAGQDAMQMSGTFVIGSDGRIRLPYYYDDIADHPPVELLLRGVMGMDWSSPLESPIQSE